MIIHAITHKIEFKKQDCWVGFYWEKRRRTTTIQNDELVYHLWICLIPMLPLHITWKLIHDKEAEK